MTGIWLTLFCLFVGIPFYWFVLTDDLSTVAFKRRYYPLFVKTVVGIIAGIFIIYGWMNKRTMAISFGGYVLIVLLFAVVIAFEMMIKFEFCDKCGATSKYWTISLQHRNYCQKCGRRFENE